MPSAKDPPSASPDQDASPEQNAASTDAERAKIQERRLIRRLRRGDQRAFTTIVRTYQQRVFNIVFRFLGNREEAEDVAQDVFVTVYQNAERFRGDSKFSTWLYRVTVNHCKNRLKYLKRRGRHMGRPLDEIAEHLVAQGSGETQPVFHAAIPRPDDLAQGRQLEALIQREMAKMDEDHRLLVVLRDIQGLSYQEMAEVTGLNVGTIKSRLHRARLALKEALARHMQ
jgi:RNA polymerase sigma-70 factor (ECF subfamily)